jgi:hypothetical protein
MSQNKNNKKIIGGGLLLLAIGIYLSYNLKSEDNNIVQIVDSQAIDSKPVINDQAAKAVEEQDSESSVSKVTQDVLVDEKDYTPEQKTAVDQFKAKGWVVEVFKEPSGTERLKLKGEKRTAASDQSLTFPISRAEWESSEKALIEGINGEEIDDLSSEEKEFIEKWKSRNR